MIKLRGLQDLAEQKGKLNAVEPVNMEMMSTLQEENLMLKNRVRSHELYKKQIDVETFIDNDL